ncbi:IS30 family transposase, partial [Streptococcus pyogenes]
YPKRLFNYKSPVEMLKLANFNLKFGIFCSSIILRKH